MSFELSQEDGEFLVKLARRAVEEYLKTKRRMSTPESISEKLKEPRGVFVTINGIENGTKELRGCIGYPYATDPLVYAIVQSAISAATEDPRFCPISLRELDKVVFEVSVLTPPQRIEARKAKDYPLKIRVGEDGLIVERSICKGLLLPQVPVEWKWNEEEFLCQCCIKAGLPPDSWLLEDTRLYKFQAVVFEEETPKGEVRRKTLDEN